VSHQALHWVLRGGPGGGAVKLPAASRHVGETTMRLVLLVLADHAAANGTGACPSQATIAVEAGLDRRTVRHALEWLVFGGLIIKTAEAVPRVRGDTYRLALGHELGRVPPPETVVDNSGGDARQSSSNSGGTRAGDPATNQNQNLSTYIPLPV
jgi:hypothetical protein